MVSDYEKIVSILEPLALSKNEIMIFLSLFKYGAQTMQAITNMSKLPRTTVQSIIERLEQRWLVLQWQQGRYPTYIALSFSELLVYGDACKQKREIFKHELIQQQDLLSNYQFVDKQKPLVTYCKWREIERIMYDKILESDFCDAVRDMEATMQLFWISENAILSYARIARFLTRRIVIDCSLARRYKQEYQSEKYKIRLLPRYQWNYSDFMLMNNAVFHVSYENTMQPLGMIIQDQAFFKFQSAMFHALRESLQE